MFRTSRRARPVPNMGERLGRPAAHRASDLEWTVVRASRVVVGAPTARYRIGILKLGPWNSVTNSDVAGFMLACLTGDTFLNQAPMVAA
jgi:hypothetical protein